MNELIVECCGKTESQCRCDENLMRCTGSPRCGVDKCHHYEPHGDDGFCSGGCFDGGRCIEKEE